MTQETMPKIVAILGTSRPDSFTSRALAVVNDEFHQNEVDLTVLDATDLTLAFPGQPDTEDAKRMRTAIDEAAGVVIATPEYHGSFAAMTKLIIENLGFPSELSGKPVALVGVAAGRIGAIKSLEQLRGVCSHVGAIVLPKAVSIAGVRGAFDDMGNCMDASVEDSLRGIARALLAFIKDYVTPKHTLEALVREDATPWPAEV